MEEIKKSEVKSLIDIIEPLDRSTHHHLLEFLTKYPEGRKDMCAVVCDVRKLGSPLSSTTDGRDGWHMLTAPLYHSAYFIYKTEKGLQYEEITIPEEIQKYIEAPGFMKINSIWEYEKDIHTIVSYISHSSPDRIEKDFRMKLSDLGLEEIDKIDKKEFEKLFEKHKKLYDEDKEKGDPY